MESTFLKFLTAFIGARYYHLLTDIDQLIASLKNTSKKTKDPFYNRSKIWEDIECDVERIKAYGKPASEWMEKWVSYEFDDEAVLLHTIEAGLVLEQKGVEVDDEEPGLDDEDHEVYDDEPGDHESKDDFVAQKVSELYKIRRAIAFRLCLCMVVAAGCIVVLIYIVRLILN